MRVRWIGRTALALVMGFAPDATFSQAAQAPVAAAEAKPGGVSGLVQPALDTVLTTVNGLKLEKWKGGSIRDEAGANIRSIVQDLQVTLPPMLAEADQAADRMSGVLPVSHNIDALYDVLLRVVDGSRVAGNADQVNQLMNAMVGLERARRALDGRMTEIAAAQEKQIGDLQAAVKAQPVPVCPVAAPVEKPAPPAAPKKRVRKKVPAAAGQPANVPPSGTAKPGTAKPNP